MVALGVVTGAASVEDSLAEPWSSKGPIVEDR